MDSKDCEENGTDRFISNLVHFGMFKNTEWQESINQSGIPGVLERQRRGNFLKITDRLTFICAICDS
jgi:hypothetical protein